jgi:exodeoxyribonuclease VII large subunit
MNKKMLPILTPSEFVALFNQTVELSFPIVEIEGEVANFKISKNRWVYFDIVDEEAKLRCFGTVYMLPAPVEDGMKVRILAAPRLHPQFNFSMNLKSLQFSGEGTIKKAADLLFEQLQKEGLFSEERKRALLYPPQKIALVTSAESAAYKDFIKILSTRYGGLQIELADVQVQGEAAIGQIVHAIDWFNKRAEIADVLVVIRGGGSADDLQVFSSEQVTRAVAASRIPTLVAIGHEIDVSLAELAADVRASTPSNAAELLVPDRRDILRHVDQLIIDLDSSAQSTIRVRLQDIDDVKLTLTEMVVQVLNDRLQLIDQLKRTLIALSPQSIMRRGYSVVRKGSQVIKKSNDLKTSDSVDIQFSDGTKHAKVQ